MDLIYKAILLSLLPTGKFWPPDWLEELFSGVGLVFQKIENHVKKIFIQESPDNIQTYMDHWGSVLEITNPTSGKIIASLGSTKGQSLNDYQEALSRLKLGYVEISYLRPLACGMSCGSRASGIQWNFTVIFKNIKDHDLNVIRNLMESFQPAHLSFLFFTEKTWIEFLKPKEQ